MGKSITPKYRLIIDNQKLVWPNKTKPTNKHLEDYIWEYAKSLEPKGCNFHISDALGYIPYPCKARIETNINYYQIPVIMAVWNAATFQVW